MRRRVEAVDLELERDGVQIEGARDVDRVWPSAAEMLDAAGYEHLRVPGDGACAYWSVLATVEGGLPRAYFTAECDPLTGRRPADVDACTRMRGLRAAVVAWLLAPEQRILLRYEREITQSFAQFAAVRLSRCARPVRDALRVQAGIPIGAAGDVIRPHEALQMLEQCELLR